MADAFIFDAVRTSGGKGKPGGALHEVTPVRLAAQVLAALRDRNGLDGFGRSRTFNLADVYDRLGVVS